jgi:CHAT domain-containing protein
MPQKLRPFLRIFAMLCLGLGGPALAQSAPPENAPLAASTTGDVFAGVDPAVLAKARGGDPAAAYDTASALVATWEEPFLRAALPFYEQAFAGGNLNTDNLWLSAISALMIGRVRAALSEYREGLAFSEQAEAIARSIDTQEAVDVVVAAMEDQAMALNALSRYQDSVAITDLLIGFHQGLTPPNEVGAANAQWTKGISHEGLSEFMEAAEAYLAAMQYYATTDGQTARMAIAALGNNMGWVLHRAGDYKQAEEWFREILPFYVEELGPYAENTSKNYINLGLSVFELGRPDEAIEFAMKAMPYIANNPVQSLADQRWNFELLARAFAAKGQPDRAIFFGKMAVNAQQAIREANTTGSGDDNKELRAEWRRLYQLLADLLITQGRISEAQAVLNMEKEEEVFQYLRRDAEADLTKTRAVLNDAELAEEDKIATLAALPIAAERELRGLMAKLDDGSLTPDEENQIYLLQDALQQATEAFDASVEAFLAEIETENRAALDAQFDAVGSYQEILNTLERPAAILQIATLDEATHLFLTLPGVTLHQEVAIARADLAREVFEALQAIETVSPDAQEKLGVLYGRLFAPVAQALEDSGTEVVMLNLDGFLRYVPFAALHDGSGYLVERYAFSLYPAAVPTQFETPDRRDAKTVGFGVTQGHPGFAPLPGVRRELETIFGDAAAPGVLDGTTALDAGFDEASLKRGLLGRPSILHIASHFNLTPGQEDDSFLLLGDGSHLPLSKIRKTRALRFQGVDLLTLSACQTARGADGAEIDGFGATAQLSGAGAVMASLWPVSDAATPRLMRDFYAGLMEGGLDKAEALRQAQIKMLHSAEAVASLDSQTTAPNRAAAALDAAALDALNQPAKAGFEHPYFWSAFVLMGNWL